MKNTLMKNNVSKVKRTKYFKPQLKKLAKLMLAGITVVTALTVTSPVMAQSIANSNVVENVRLPNAEYTQSVVDMRVKVRVVKSSWSAPGAMGAGT